MEQWNFLAVQFYLQFERSKCSTSLWIDQISDSILLAQNWKNVPDIHCTSTFEIISQVYEKRSPTCPAISFQIFRESQQMRQKGMGRLRKNFKIERIPTRSNERNVLKIASEGIWKRFSSLFSNGFATRRREYNHSRCNRRGNESTWVSFTRNFRKFLTFWL